MKVANSDQMYMIIGMSAVRKGSEASISAPEDDAFATGEPACPGQTAPTQWTEVDHQVLILDTDRSHVYRVPTASVSAELMSAHLQTSTSRRRFIQALAAGSVAGATIMALPTAAAAASAVQPIVPADAQPDADPSEDPEEQDGTIRVTGTTTGDGTVTLDWEDTS
jgi:hypothetical protein